MTSPPPSRALRPDSALTILVGCSVLIGSVFAVASPAMAHNALVASSPEAESILATLPPEFSITTNEDMLDTGDSVSAFVLQVVGEDGLYYGDGCVSVDGPTVSTAAALGPAGQYTLAWRAVSIDSHEIYGEFNFEWDPADDAESSAGSATPPECGEQSKGQSQETAPETEATTPASGDPQQTSSTSPTSLIIAGIAAGAAAVIGGIAFALRRRRNG